MKIDKGEYLSIGGVKVPLGKGFGTFPHKEELKRIIPQAFETGFRIFDTSDNYLNEEYVGIALQELKDEEREQLILVTKFSEAASTRKFNELFEKSKILLGKEKGAIDIYLLHWPYPFLYKKIWYMMEELYKEGKCKAIGVCNFEIKHLKSLEKHARIKPMVNQIEINPMFQQTDICNYCQEKGIQIMSYSPLARMNETLMTNDILNKIAKKYNRNVVQIVLRWNYQKGYLALPASKSRENIENNYNIFDFCLTEADMDLIANLDSGLRIRFDPNKRFNTLQKLIFLKERVLLETIYRKR